MAQYSAGVDLGTTFTAAAISRDGRQEMVALGAARAAIPSVVLLREDDTISVGEAAAARGRNHPDRLAREFKRRIGDPAPLVLGGTPLPIHILTGRLLRWVIDRVTEREGGPPARVAVTHPANWGPFKLEVLRQAVEYAEVPDVVFVSEPAAAAAHYASLTRVAPGSLVAVYDLGGGTFDAAVLRKTDGGFEIAGEPQGIEQLGGIDFDDVLFRHVADHLDGALDGGDPTASGWLSALQHLRDNCVVAKHTLSSEPDASVSVLLPALQREVHVTRAEFERAIRPAIAETIDALRRALREAGVEAEDVTKVLLVGGSSRIPLVAQMVSEGLGVDVAVDADPKNAIALGAALVAAQATQVEVPSAAPPPPTPPTPAPSTPPPPRRRVSRAALLGAGAAAAVVVAVLAFVLLSGGDGDEPAAATNADPTVPTTTVDEGDGGATSDPGTERATITVAADESGDVPTLADAVAAVADGGTINLGAGTFDVDPGLVIDKGVTLVGEGPTATEIAAGAADFVVRFTGSGTFAVQGVAFRYTGSDGDVVIVDGGTVDFADCAVSGGRSAVNGVAPFGKGLAGNGDVTGTVQRCRADGNAEGFSFVDEAAIDVLATTATNNDIAGMVFGGNSTGDVRDNVVSENNLGIEILGSAAPTLEANTVEANRLDGITYRDEATGTARDNVVVGNEGSGIHVTGAAAPLLEDNLVRGNRVIGIRFTETSAGAAVGNEVTGNGIGLLVEADAAPTLQGNDVRDNEDIDLSDQRLALRGDGLGIANFGQRAADVLATFAIQGGGGSVLLDDTQEGETCSTRFVIFGNGTAVSFNDTSADPPPPDEWIFVSWIQTIPSLLTDRKGIGAGARFSDVVAAYGSSFDMAYDAEDDVTTLTIDESVEGAGGMRFEFEGADPLPDSEVTIAAAGTPCSG